MLSRLCKFIKDRCPPFGTVYSPASFGMDASQFFLAVLRVCPTGSKLDLNQCENERWVHGLRKWSHRRSEGQFEADHYIVDREFVKQVEDFLRSHPSDLGELHHIGLTAPNGNSIMDSLDNFTYVAYLDKQTAEKLMAAKK